MNLERDDEGLLPAMPNEAAGSVRASNLSLAELAAKTEAAERHILAGALERLAVVRAELDGLCPTATDREAEDPYLELRKEVWELEGVIARARAVLG